MPILHHAVLHFILNQKLSNFFQFSSKESECATAFIPFFSVDFWQKKLFIHFDPTHGKTNVVYGSIFPSKSRLPTHNVYTLDWPWNLFTPFFLSLYKVLEHSHRLMSSPTQVYRHPRQWMVFLLSTRLIVSSSVFSAGFREKTTFFHLSDTWKIV